MRVFLKYLPLCSFLNEAKGFILEPYLKIWVESANYHVKRSMFSSNRRKSVHKIRLGSVQNRKGVFLIPFFQRCPAFPFEQF